MYSDTIDCCDYILIPYFPSGLCDWCTAGFFMDCLCCFWWAFM